MGMRWVGRGEEGGGPLFELVLSVGLLPLCRHLHLMFLAHPCDPFLGCGGPSVGSGLVRFRMHALSSQALLEVCLEWVRVLVGLWCCGWLCGVVVIIV